MENDNKRIKACIRDILSGRPVAEIPRHLVLKVHNAIDSNKNKFNLNQSRYNQIMHEFQNVEKRFGLNKQVIQPAQNIKIDTHQSIENKNNDEPIIYDESDIEDILEGLIQGGSFENIQTESIDSIIDYCKKKIDQLVNNDELKEASVHQNILDEIIQLSYERKYISTMMSKKEGISEQISFLNQKIQEEKERVANEIQKIDQETFILLEMEEDEWGRSLFEFDFETSQGPPPKFMKLSGKLLNLKQVEKFLIKSKRFSEASKIHEVSSKFEEKELKIQHEIFINEREDKKRQLNILHQTRIQNIQSSADRKKKVIEQKSQALINSLNNTIRHILIKENDIDNLINEEKKIQEDEIKSVFKNNENNSQVKKKKKRSVSLKPKQNKKVIKRVHFADNV